MVGHGGSSAGSCLADPTSPIPSHCASIVVTSTLRVNNEPITYSHKTLREINWPSAVTGHTSHVMRGLVFDLVICKHKKEYGHTWH